MFHLVLKYFLHNKPPSLMLLFDALLSGDDMGRARSKQKSKN